MADVKNRVSLHLVWTTYDRLPKLTPEVMEVVHQCVRAAGDALRCPVIAIGGVEDHLHVLVHFSTTVKIAVLTQEMKGYSSRVVNERFPERNFKWQGGYGVFPVSPGVKATVENYIARQAEHHAKQTIIASLEDTGFPVRGGALESQKPGF